MDNSEFLTLLESEQQLRNTIGEAVRMLEGVEPTLADGCLGEPGAMEAGADGTGLSHGSAAA
eukprot:10271809-Lingulodinium_polyedra.AAC.1